MGKTKEKLGWQHKDRSYKNKLLGWEVDEAGSRCCTMMTFDVGVLDISALLQNLTSLLASLLKI
jgi:hypothetical protein